MEDHRVPHPPPTCGAPASAPAGDRRPPAPPSQTGSRGSRPPVCRPPVCRPPVSRPPVSRPPLSRPLVLCADDFALSEGVSTAILDLVARGRLSAVSCMTASPLWPAHAARLPAGVSGCEFGLHLTLTDHAPLGPMPVLAPKGRLPPLRRLALLAHAGGLDAGEIGAEIGRQWRAFDAAYGAPPAFIDGHQHVHLLPAVRGAVLSLLAALPARSRPWLRVCWEAPKPVLQRRIATGKALLLSILSLPLRRAAVRMGIRCNDSFRGVHDFNTAANFSSIFTRFLAPAASRPLVMCHPGFVDDYLRAVDPLTDARRNEYDYLASDRFPADLSAAGVHLARFGDIG